jgi:hypothetical protein
VSRAMDLNVVGMVVDSATGADDSYVDTTTLNLVPEVARALEPQPPSEAPLPPPATDAMVPVIAPVLGSPDLPAALPATETQPH